MTREERKQHLIDMMEADARDGLYDEGFKKPRTITYYKDAAVVRLHNRRITMLPDGDDVRIKFEFFVGRDVEPKPGQRKNRGILITFMRLSKESLSGLAQAIRGIEKNY